MLNVGGKLFELDKKIIDQFPDSVFEAIFSGRQQMKIIDDVPYMDRNVHAFERLLSVINLREAETYYKLD